MAQQTINVGAAPNDGTGTPLRTAFQYTNSNFTELYTAVGPSGNNIVVPGNATISGAANFNGGALAAYLNGSLLVGSSGNVVNLYAQSSGLHIKNNTGAFPLLTVNNSGDYTFQDGAGGTRMTLNSTGLGVGVSPATKFDVGLAGAGTPRIQFTSASDNPIYQTQRYSGVGSNYFGERLITGGGFFFQSAPSAAVGSQTFTTNMTLDASGNLLVGTTSGTFRGTFVVAGGANRDILAAGVTAISDGFQVKWNHATTKINVIISNMPTSSAGLAAGTLWNDAGTIKIA